MSDDLDIEDLLRRADDLCRRARALVLEAKRVGDRVAIVTRPTEATPDEWDQVAIGAVTPVAGRS